MDNTDSNMLVSNILRRRADDFRGPLQETLPEMLRASRKYLGMDVSFISEFSSGRRVYRHIDADEGDVGIVRGDSDPVEQTFCQRIVDGKLPELIPDVSAVPEAASLPVTERLSIGAYLGVPVRLNDGRIWGTFCCYSHHPDKTLNERDLGMVRLFAELAGKEIDRDLAARRQLFEMQERIQSILDGDALTVVYQPIFNLRENRPVGFESLSRFSLLPVRTPDIWFNEAANLGFSIPLENKAIKTALLGLEQLPPDIYLSFNASPAVILSEDFPSLLADAPLSRVVLEITEHASIDNYAVLIAALDPLRKAGLRLAVDDAGAGYASFRHILNLTPDIIKLDVSLTANIDTDRSRRALSAALIRFAEETGSIVIAEGVKTRSEVDALRDLGATKAQGFLLGEPMSIEKAALLCANTSVNRQ